MLSDCRALTWPGLAVVYSALGGLLFFVPAGFLLPVRLLRAASHCFLSMLLAVSDPQDMVPLPTAAAECGLELLLTNLWVGKGKLPSLLLGTSRSGAYVVWV